jgi:Tfp pilus assembly protein PilF
LYEKREDIANATYYWQKRYELGEEGEYWHEVARQHLLKLGTYPQVKKEMLEKKAIMLSQEMTEKREEEKFKSIEEARMHYDLGYDLVMKGDYAGALKELETALSLNPPDEELKTSIRELYRSTEKLYVKQQALHNTEDALGYIKNEDFISAGEKLKNALTEVFRIAQEK